MATVLAVVALAALPVVSAYAKSVPSSVRIAARAVVARVGQQTHATSTKVLGCRRSTSSRYFCQVQNTFRTGASRCVADVRVTVLVVGVGVVADVFVDPPAVAKSDRDVGQKHPD